MPNTLQTARSSRPSRWRSWLLLTPALTVLALFGTGLVSALVQSFGYQPYVSSRRWSLDAYQALFQDQAFQQSLGLTVRVALLATGLSLLFGVSCGLVLHRVAHRTRVLRLLFSLNLAVPHLVGALAISLLLAQSGFVSRVTHAAGLTATPQAFPALVQDRFGWGIIAEYVWKETPFVAIITLVAMGRRVDELEQVARDLGARWWQRLRHVTLPLIAAPVTAAGVLVLAYSVASYEVPLLLGQTYPATLSVVAYQSYSDTDLLMRPQAMAACVVLAAGSALVISIYLWLIRRLTPTAL